MRSIKEIFRSYAIFDADGRHVNGTDKQSNHNYGDAYEQLFPDRNRVEAVMEVGVADGSCLMAWEDIFPNAIIVGMDVHPISKYAQRVEFHLGDQTVLQDCKRAAGGRLFDLIVDDATHNLEDTLRTLLYLWPYVNPVRGLYVIEEFPNLGELRDNIIQLFPFAEVVDTQGPFGGIEPLVVLRKLP